MKQELRYHADEVASCENPIGQKTDSDIRNDQCKREEQRNVALQESVSEEAQSITKKERNDHSVSQSSSRVVFCTVNEAVSQQTNVLSDENLPDFRVELG